MVDVRYARRVAQVLRRKGDGKQGFNEGVSDLLDILTANEVVTYYDEAVQSASVLVALGPHEGFYRQGVVAMLAAVVPGRYLKLLPPAANAVIERL